MVRTAVLRTAGSSQNHEDRGAGTRRRLASPWAAALVAVLAGTAIGLSFPPRGWWFLAPVGVGTLGATLLGQPARRRFVLGVAAGIGMFGTGMISISGPGAPPLVILAELGAAGALSLFVGLTAALVPPTPRLAAGLPAALVLVAALRARWPFGGLPGIGVALGQVDGPFAVLGRVGGEGALLAAAAVVGAVGAACWRRPAVLALAAGAVGLAVLGAHLAPGGRAVRAIDAVTVQGGGVRGVGAMSWDDAYRRQMAAVRLVGGGADLVVLPEGTAHVDGAYQASAEAAELGRVARRLDATLAAGLVEVEPRRFVNTVTVWAPGGDVVGRYVKRHPVPFGERVPARGLIERLVDLDGLVPRDMVAGDRPGVVETPAGRLGAVISFEVFFGPLVRDTVRAGAQVVLVPTNAGSFTNGAVPAIELAAARLRAIESGRYVLQAAPSGYSAIVAPSGEVVRRSPLGERAAVLHHRIELRDGSTLYTRFGDWPVIALAALGLAAAWRPWLRRHVVSRR